MLCELESTLLVAYYHELVIDPYVSIAVVVESDQ
jgi:hypothetical protein